MMALVTDMDADVVEQRRVLEPLPFGVAQAVDAAGLVEHGHAQLRDVPGVIRRVSAALGELDHTAAAHVRVAVDLADVPCIALNVIEYEPFAKREIGQGQFLRAEPAKQEIEKHGSGDGDVGAPRIESGDVQPRREIQIG
jgi:hypothetical protein